MYTSNGATKDLPTTYMSRRQECERLLKITRQMEAVAFGAESFSDDPRFVELGHRLIKAHPNSN